MLPLLSLLTIHPPLSPLVPRLYTHRLWNPLVQPMTSSQSNNTAASPSMEPPSKKRPADDDTVTPSRKPSPSGTKPSNSNNIVAPPRERSASASEPCSFEIPKRLWTIFVAKHAPMLPILNLDQLTAAFALAVSHGKVGPTVIDPTFGLCIAIACHLTPDEDLWGGGNWYNAAFSNMAYPFKSRPSIQSFHHQILQVQYLHMVGHLRKAWDVLSLAIGRAQSLRMQTMHGGSLAVDENSLEQVRLVWQCLWMKKLSLTLQYGVVHQSLDTFYVLPIPMKHHIHGNMKVSGAETNEHCHAISSFFVACASLLKYPDDLITVENDLRVIRMECSIKSLSSVDLHGFQQLNEKLSSWKIGLPKCLG
ncbi:transcriptional regulator family: Fungal Specific TF [Penicillium desertorum]|uniref:Transcriptional regulator family: Fungal Specific TF n=1 Tax=Penicillium desertorum TaxID=1303715 RepID=A0A9X0BTG2_9EURO|nr:transcriptional regulator family: Fungal Specific TF [Penicillium desertorum]